MKRIFKYGIPVADHFKLELPVDAEVLTFQSQKESFYIWAIVDDPGQKTQKRYFRLAGTGHDLTEDYPKIKKYIGTAQIGGGGLVFHLFELYKFELYRKGEVTLSKKGEKRIKEALEDIKRGKILPV